MGSLCTSELCLAIMISLGSSWEEFLDKCSIATWAPTAEVSSSSRLRSHSGDFKSSHDWWIICFSVINEKVWFAFQSYQVPSGTNTVSLTLASRGSLGLTSSCSEPQISTGQFPRCPWPALHAAQTQFISLFPFLLDSGGLLSGVSKVETSVRRLWGWRLLISMISSPSADPVPARLTPTGSGSLGPQQIQLSIFLAWCKSGTFLPQHCEVHVNTLWFCGHLFPAPPSTDLLNVKHSDCLVGYKRW